MQPEYSYTVSFTIYRYVLVFLEIFKWYCGGFHTHND